MSSQVNKNILVTGGTGFIGTHLVNELVRKYPGCTIEIVDDLSSSSVSAERLEFFRQHGITFNHISVGEFSLFPDVRYDQIYHLACKVGPAHVLKFAGRMGLEIMLDAMRMAELAIRDDAPLLSISTLEVYGKGVPGEPQHEDLPLQIPATSSARLEYTAAKLMTEIQLLNLAKVTPLRVTLIRPFNIVGPYQTGEGGFVLPRFVEAALTGKPLTVFGDGSQVRAFTHVSDMVQAMILAMESGVRGRIYNVGSPRNTCTIMELAERVIGLTLSRSVIQCVDPRTIFGSSYADAADKIPDIRRIKQELFWRPLWGLDDIITDYDMFVSERNRQALSAA